MATIYKQMLMQGIHPDVALTRIMAENIVRNTEQRLHEIQRNNAGSETQNDLLQHQAEGGHAFTKQADRHQEGATSISDESASQAEKLEEVAQSYTPIFDLMNRRSKRDAELREKDDSWFEQMFKKIEDSWNRGER